MADDTYTYHINQSVISYKNNTFTRLISEDRTKKLELLKHLLTNSSQPLVICGPEGIGKSTLLKVLQEQTMAKWSYCTIVSPADLSFEKLQQSIMQAINQSSTNKQNQNFFDLFQQLNRQHKKLILMIDNAGFLMPGLINQIITLAKQYSALRVIFVLDHHELELKNRSDTTIDEANLIEIPALSEAQCTEFLYQIASTPQSAITVNDINDALISAVYQETQGIPGLIVTKFPRNDNDENNTKSLRLLILAIMTLIVLALCTHWFSNSNYNIKRIAIKEEVDTTIIKTKLFE
jgi:DamX protein